MPTKNPRVNVTFDENLIEVLSYISIQESKSIASLVRELTVEALEKREDYYLSKLADKLDHKDVTIYSHEEVWK